jgi:hypothetical protein
MKIATPLHTDHQLDQLAGQFEHWRRTRSHPGGQPLAHFSDSTVMKAVSSFFTIRESQCYDTLETL